MLNFLPPQSSHLLGWPLAFSTQHYTPYCVPHPMAHDHFLCTCNQPIDSTWIHLLGCVHGGKHIATHDTVWNFFIFIVRDVIFHVFCEQTHVLLTPSLWSSWWWMDIVITTNGIPILVGIVIIDPTSVDLVSWVVSTWWTVAMWL
jgi:hypothetical protein